MVLWPDSPCAHNRQHPGPTTQDAWAASPPFLTTSLTNHQCIPLPPPPRQERTRSVVLSTELREALRIRGGAANPGCGCACAAVCCSCRCAVQTQAQTRIDTCKLRRCQPLEPAQGAWCETGRGKRRPQQCPIREQPSLQGGGRADRSPTHHRRLCQECDPTAAAPCALGRPL